MAYGDLKCRNLIWNSGSGDNTVVLSTLATQSYVTTNFAPKSNPTFAGTINGADLVLSGNLTVSGTQTIINTNVLQVEDKHIEIGKVSTPSDTTADGGGIILKASSDRTFVWINSTDAWTSSEHIQVASGKTFIGDGSTLTALNATNLASGTVPTARLGTGTAGSSNFLRGDGSWQAIATDKIEEGNTSVEAVDTGSDGHVKITTEGTEKVRVTNDGKVGIGVTPSHALHLKTQSGSGNEELKIESESGYDATLLLDTSNGGGAGAQIHFQMDGATKGGIEYVNNAGSASVNNMIFRTTTNAERFRLGASGQIGIAGANYGSSGQVLTSGGSGAAPSWAAVPPGGNTIDLVADGAIAAGKPVIITTAGKAQQIAETIISRTSTTNSSIATNNKPDRNAANYALAYDTTKDRVVIATQNKINIANISTGLGTTSITLGSDYQYDSQGRQPALVFDPDTEDTYLAFRDQSSSNHGKIGGLIISGTGNTTVSCPTGYYTFHSGSTDTIKLVYDTSANKIIIVYRDSTTKYYTARVAEVGSNQALTFGSEVSTGVYGDEGKMSAAYDASANRLVMCMGDDSDSNKGKYVVGTVSGTSISFTSKASLTTNEVHYVNMTYHAGEQKTIVSLSDRSSSNILRSIAGTVSSSSVSWGSISSFPGGYGTGCNVIAEDPFTNLIFRGLVFPNDTRMYYAYSSLSGTTFNNLGTNAQGSNDHGTSWEDMAITPMGNHARMVVIAYNSSYSRPGIYVYDMGQMGSNANSKNGLGFAPLAISDGNTGTINLPGNVVGNQSGLTAGQRYFIQGDGTLGTSIDNSLGGGYDSTKAGLALSATSLLIADYRS
jgi:hypothetical protein